MDTVNLQITSDPVIERIVAIIVKKIDPDKIILFGSRARGEENPNSDYDICILKQGIENERNKITKQLYLDLHEIGEPIDLIVEALERFPKLIKFKSYIYRYIDKDGIIIYEKPERSLRVA